MLASRRFQRIGDHAAGTLVVYTDGASGAVAAPEANGPDPAPPHADSELLARMVRTLTARTPYRQPGPSARFAAGDRVITRSDAPAGHTRLPRYARGRPGVIDRVHGCYIFPDTNAHGQGEQPHAL